MRILYLEDDLTNLALFERVTKMHNDELVTVQTPEEAFHELEAGDFDLILADIQLGAGVMDGLEFTAYVREAGVRTPIVMLTAYDFDAYYRRSIEAGSDYHLLKPISVNELMALLDEFRH